jgi:hypothetical protein
LLKTKTISTISAILILVGAVYLPTEIHEVNANGINVDEDEFGMIIPKNNTNLMMPEAQVLFEVSSTNNLKEYEIKFDANYTIFNPNETTTTLVGAPFVHWASFDLNNFKVLANETEIEYENMTIEYYEDSPWYEYLGDQMERDIYVSNLTFASNTSTTLHYSFDYKLFWKEGNAYYGFAILHYDVGTARAWSGNITETVAIAAYGQQPSTLRCVGRTETGWYEVEPTIKEVENGFKYSWSWENERIEEDRITCHFSFYQRILSPLNQFIIGVTLGSAAFLAFTVFIIIKIRKIRKRKKM